MLFTTIVDRTNGAYRISLGYAKEIICKIYGCSSCKFVDNEEIVGVEVGVDEQERKFELDDLWGYRLITWDPLVNYLAHHYVTSSPDLPENLFKDFMGTTLILWSEIDHWQNMTDLLTRAYGMDFVSLTPLLYERALEEGAPIISSKYKIIQEPKGKIAYMK